MDYKDYLYIYNSIHFKYENCIIPKLPDIICTFIYNNPHEHKKYLSSKIDVNELLLYLSICNDETNILDGVINYVEEICKIT